MRTQRGIGVRMRAISVALEEHEHDVLALLTRKIVVLPKRKIARVAMLIGFRELLADPHKAFVAMVRDMQEAAALHPQDEVVDEVEDRTVVEVEE